ncbi:MAG: L,D-transpeptidase family protein [Actinomycetota bacterium]|nr:L,D-transpeptidase family protein [Actinomycetota bacterium]
MSVMAVASLGAGMLSVLGAVAAPSAGAASVAMQAPAAAQMSGELRTDIVGTAAQPIPDYYAQQGGAGSFLGAPVNGVQYQAGPGVAEDFAGGTVYYSPSTGAHSVHGAILGHYQALGGPTGLLGYPVTDETGTPDGVGRYNHFSNDASIYWTPQTGAWSVHGGIRDRWAAMGWERGPVGYPVTDETGTPDGVGRYNHFSNDASIYWTPQTGAWSVHGAIRDRWQSMGWERGPLGYPVSDEFGIPGGRQSNFEHGAITWNGARGAVASLGCSGNDPAIYGVDPNQMATTGGGSQLITVAAPGPSSQSGTLTAWDRAATGCWVPHVFGGQPPQPYRAELGYGGIKPLSQRVSGDGSTPSGLFGFQSRMYGVSGSSPNPAYGYQQLTCGDWWDEQPGSATYDSFQVYPCGATPSFAGDSEQLWTETTAYVHFADILTPHPPQNSSGIFLHDDTTAGDTAGCVALPPGELDAVLGWMTPGAGPHIAIGVSGGINAL